MLNKETIYALSSATGKSAIAVFRISGKNCLKIAKKTMSVNKIKPRTATVVNIYTNKIKQKILDKGIITFFKRPKSYTGEDMIEISVHGGGAVIQKLSKTLNETKLCRPAEQGEFTRRAFENNKLDLIQVESIADLINSETDAQREQALEHLGGGLSKKINKWTKKIKKILANIEAAIDFPEDDIPLGIINTNKEQTENIIKELNYFLNDNNYGERIRSGFKISILGKTNTGKSSLINYLAKREIAIVSKIPGTTRDIIELRYDIKGLPITFYDTAGLRKTNRKIEKIGVNKAIKSSKNSNINLVLLKNDKEINIYQKKLKNIVFARAKCDILSNKKISKNISFFSSKNGKGIDDLLDILHSKLISQNNFVENIHISRERQRKLLENCLKCLKISINIDQLDIMAEEIRQSLIYLSKISGNYDIEEILDLIFDEFCIGK